MSNYPAHVAVIAPDFVTVHEEASGGYQPRYVFLNAFALLKVERHGRAFRFEEVRQGDETGTAGVRLLTGLSSHVDPDATLAGHRLDRTVAALIRVPSDDPQEADAEPALQRLKAALANAVQDAAWYDRNPNRAVEQLADDFDLPAEWHRPTRQANPSRLERELSARAQSAWLTIAHACLDPDDLRRALADYDTWRTAHAIA